MKNLHKYFWVIILFAAPLSLDVLADGGQRTTGLLKTSGQQGEISQSQAISIAQQHIQGRVLDIKRSNGTYRIKILNDQGSVHVLEVSVTNGQIVSSH